MEFHKLEFLALILKILTAHELLQLETIPGKQLAMVKGTKMQSDTPISNTHGKQKLV